MVVMRKAALNHLHVLTVLVFSRVVTVVFIGTIMLATKRKILIRRKGILRFVLLLGFGNLVLNWLGNQGLQWTTATSAAMLFKADVLFTIALGWLFLGERVPAAQYPFIAIALAGFAMVMALGGKPAASEGEHRLLGNVFCIIFGLVLTLNAILIRAKLTPLGKMQLTFWNVFVGLMLFSTAWAMVHARGVVDIRAEVRILVHTPRLAAIVAGSGIAAAVTFVSYYQAIWNLPLWVVRVIMLLSPAFAFGLAACVLDEKAGWLLLAGMVLLLGGTAGVVTMGRQLGKQANGDDDG